MLQQTGLSGYQSCASEQISTPYNWKQSKYETEILAQPHPSKEEIDRNRMQQLEYMIDKSLQHQQKLTILNQAFEVHKATQKIYQETSEEEKWQTGNTEEQRDVTDSTENQKHQPRDTNHPTLQQEEKAKEDNIEREVQKSEEQDKSYCIQTEIEKIWEALNKKTQEKEDKETRKEREEEIQEQYHIPLMQKETTQGNKETGETALNRMEKNKHTWEQEEEREGKEGNKEAYINAHTGTNAPKGGTKGRITSHRRRNNNRKRQPKHRKKEDQRRER